jgi:hypothetical protein
MRDAISLVRLLSNSWKRLETKGDPINMTDQLISKDWTYRGEGRSNVVISYIGFSYFFVRIFEIFMMRRYIYIYMYTYIDLLYS